MIDLEEISKKIYRICKENGYRKILIQFPDGLKYRFSEVIDYLEKNLDIEIYVWYGSNFGACDVPIWLSIYGFDAIFNIGHSKQKWTKDFYSLE